MRFGMSLEEAILEAVRELPPDKQQEILDHATDHAIARPQRNR
jgi:hypothetical protein